MANSREKNTSELRQVTRILKSARARIKCGRCSGNDEGRMPWCKDQVTLGVVVCGLPLPGNSLRL